MEKITLGQEAKIMILVEQKMSNEQLQNLLNSGLLSDLFDADVDSIDRNAFRQVIGLAPLNIFNLTIDYNRSVEDGVRAGKYEWENNDITSKHFPSSQEAGTAEVAIEIFHFNKSMETNNVLKEMKKNGYRPATLQELLALGEKHPDLQREGPVIALGSVWQNPNGNCFYPYISLYDSKRSLFLNWIAYEWDSLCRFAAVRK